MKDVASTQEVFSTIECVKGNATTFCTNFYLSQPKLETWIARKELKIQRCRDAAFFFQKDRDFWHLYYCARNTEALREGLENLAPLRSERIVADVLGKPDQIMPLLLIMADAGLRPYKELMRMARGATTEYDSLIQVAGEDGVSFAEACEAQAALTLIEAGFDPFAKQIPPLEEIEAAIASCQILVLHHENTLAGLLFFETRGVTSTVRFWTVAENLRNGRRGGALMRHYLASQTAVRRFILWVNSDNDDALRKYRHYHYETDGVIDCVLANEWIAG